MSYRNTEQSFGSVAKSLHWIIALLILLAYCLIYTSHLFVLGSPPEYRFLLRQHVIVGMVTLLLVLLRLGWRLHNVHPVTEQAGRMEQLGARLVHQMLYALMILQPLTGWLGFRGPVYFWNLFSIPAVRDWRLYHLIITTGLGWTWEQFEAVMDLLHKEVIGSWMLWILVTCHVAAALYHQLIRRDPTLRRMLPK